MIYLQNDGLMDFGGVKRIPGCFWTAPSYTAWSYIIVTADDYQRGNEVL